MNNDFAERQKCYEKCYDYSLTSRLPIVIRTHVKAFVKLTKDVTKPFCYKLSSAMAYTMFESIKHIDSSIIGYTYNDEIIFVLYPQKIDSQPWLANNLQKICSTISSLCTYYFNNFISTAIEPPNINVPVLFDANVFVLPNTTEVINNLILRQQDCRIQAISNATLHELTKKYDANIAHKILKQKKISQRLELLKDEFDINFEEYYPSNYKLGTATYRAPKVFKTQDTNVTRIKWILDIEPPIFTMDRMFLVQLLSTGTDIFRPDRDFKH